MKKIKAKTSHKLNSIMSFIITFLLGLLLGIVICNFNNLTLTNDIELDVIENCNYNFKEYLTLEDSDIYLNCVNEVKIKTKNTYITLQEYLKNNKIEDILNNLELDGELWDGGTKIYKGENITIIKCNTLEGNNDIYIGTENMKQTDAFDNGACGKNFFSDKEFERTYKLDSIKVAEEIELEDKIVNLYELTFSDESGNSAKISAVFGNNLVVTLQGESLAHILKEKYLKILEEGESYTITFGNKYEELIKDNIEDIFKNSTIKDISLSK